MCSDSRRPSAQRGSYQRGRLRHCARMDITFDSAISVCIWNAREYSLRVRSTTKGKVLIEDNYFSSQMHDILIEGDSNSRCESGGVRDVVITNNTFADIGYAGPANSQTC